MSALIKLIFCFHFQGRITYYGDAQNFYQGSWNVGIQWGYGIRQWPSGNFHEGQWARGLPHGRGNKFWLSDRVYFRGEFEEGLPVGLLSIRFRQWVVRHSCLNFAFCIEARIRVNGVAWSRSTRCGTI